MKSETIYKLRFLPFFAGILLLSVSATLKYGASADTGDLVVWSIFLTLGGWICSRWITQEKDEQAQKADLANNPPSPPTQEELLQKHEKEIDNGVELQKNNIIIRSVMLFALILGLTGFIYILITEEKYLLSAIFLLLGIGGVIYSIHLLKKWISYLKYFKEEKQKIEKTK